MREAVGNSFVMGIVATIIGFIMIFFVGSISYSKAYRVKNKIINMIEENGGWTASLDKTDNQNGIPAYLKEVGYQVGTGRVNNACKCKNDNECVVLKNTKESNTYNYCVLQYSSNAGTYYRVITFMKFELPITRFGIEFPVAGETKTFGFFNSKNK